MGTGPVVDLFVLGSQSKREDSDLKSIQDAMRKANEMDAVFLEDIKTAASKFNQVMAKRTWYSTLSYCDIIPVECLLLWFHGSIPYSRKLGKVFNLVIWRV